MAFFPFLLSQRARPTDDSFIYFPVCAFVTESKKHVYLCLYFLIMCHYAYVDVLVIDKLLVFGCLFVSVWTLCKSNIDDVVDFLSLYFQYTCPNDSGLGISRH